MDPKESTTFDIIENGTESVREKITPGSDQVLPGNIFTYSIARTGDKPIATGKADVTNDTPMTPDTIMPVASITKMFTAATLLIMTETDEYKEQFAPDVEHPIDTPVKHFEASLRERFPGNSDFFDHLAELPDYQNGNMTLKNLLQHTSGLGNRAVGCGADVAKDAQENPEKIWGSEEALKWEYSIDPNKRDDDPSKDTKTPFGECHYSNTGFDLLGAIVEAIEFKKLGGRERGAPAKDLGLIMHEKVIDPLGLTHSYTSHDDIPDDKQVVAPYDAESRGEGNPQGRDRTHTFTHAAGMIRSTASDINKFTEAFFSRAKEGESEPLFKDEITRNMIHECEKNPQKKHPEQSIGLGFKVFTGEQDKQYCGHDGSTGSLTLFDPATSKAATYIHLNAQTGRAAPAKDKVRAVTESPEFEKAKSLLKKTDMKVADESAPPAVSLANKSNFRS